MALSFVRTAVPADPEDAGRWLSDGSRRDAVLADFRNSIAAYPSTTELATIGVPAVCSYGSRSQSNIVALVRALAAAIPTATARQIDGAGHAAPFDATANFVRLIADSIMGAGRDRS